MKTYATRDASRDAVRPTRAVRVCILLLALLLTFTLPIAADDLSNDDLSNDDLSSDGGENVKVYSYSYEEGDEQASLHLHPSFAERAYGDLLDAFVETAGYGAALYVDVGNVKLYFTAKAVGELAARGEPIVLYIKKIVPDAEETSEAADDTSGDTSNDTSEDTPDDVVYEIDLGFPFDYKSLKIRVKHTTSNADGLRVLAVDEKGGETTLASAYGDATVEFFPETAAFTLRITEEPVPEGLSKLLILLSAALVLLVALSVALVVLLKKGVLRRVFLTRYDR